MCSDGQRHYSELICFCNHLLIGVSCGIGSETPRLETSPMNVKLSSCLATLHHSFGQISGNPLLGPKPAFWCFHSWPKEGAVSRPQCLNKIVSLPLLLGWPPTSTCTVFVYGLTGWMYSVKAWFNKHNLSNPYQGAYFSFVFINYYFMLGYAG